MNHLSRTLPLSTSDTPWRIAAAVSSALVLAAVALLLFSGTGSDIGRPMVSLAVAFFACAAFVLPLVSFLCMAVLLQLVAAFPDFSGPFFVLGIIVMAAILAYRLPGWVSAACAVIFWYTAQTDFYRGIYVPEYAEPALFLGLLLTAAWVSGWALSLSARRRAAQASDFERRIEEERERTVTSLHGSVAASLTSVVLRSEALAMSADPATSDAAQHIARDARRSMQEVRELIRFMRDDEPPAQTAIPNPPELLLDAALSFAENLREHGFSVIDTGLNPRTFGGFSLPPASAVFRELQTNLLKYADPTRPVIIAAVQEDGWLCLAIQNTIASRQRDAHMTTGIGLAEVAGLLEAHGGSFATSWEDDAWRYELRIPPERK